MQGVVQLGQAYVKLSEIGDVYYLNWKKEYKCKSRLGIDVTNDITAQTKEFERHYQACKEHVNVQRMKHRELNYFTTQQLLFLRKELASIKSGAPLNVLSVQVYALLEKICPDIHPSTLHAALYDTGFFAQNEDNGDGSVSEQFPPPGIDIEVDNEQTADQQLEIVQMYERLLKHAERLSPKAERLAIAAIVYGCQNNVWGDADLVVWCALNKANVDLINKLYSKARSSPPFRSIVDEAVESDSSQCSEDSDGVNIRYPLFVLIINAYVNVKRKLCASDSISTSIFCIKTFFCCSFDAVAINSITAFSFISVKLLMLSASSLLLPF